jgi:hypothetical protein
VAVLPSPPGERANDPWALPDIVGVDAARVRYPQPRSYYDGVQLKQAGEAVELLVRTSSQFPARALSPVLYVGETAIARYEPVSLNQYRFVAYNMQDLKEGSPISLGWPLLPQRRVQTPFRYTLKPRVTS